MSNRPVDFVCVGSLRADYGPLHTGELLVQALGGHAIYAAVGARLWGESVGIAARVGEDYPAEWLDLLASRGFDIRGIKQVTGVHTAHPSTGNLEPEEGTDTGGIQPGNVSSGVPAHNQPQADYSPVSSTFGPLAVRPNDMPPEYTYAKGAHLCPDDYIVHHTLPVALRQGGVSYVTCDPDSAYLLPACADYVRSVVQSLDAFMPSAAEVRAFFKNQTDDLWQAAEAFAAMGCRIIVIKLGAQGQYLYDAEAQRKWIVPAYPSKVRDRTGAGDAYGGGFLVGLARTEDPLQAALYGSVAASLVIEGSGALYALDSTPGLAAARLEALRDAVRQI